VSGVENVDLDILFVRTNDVVEFVRDAVADLGITGADLLAEAGDDLPVVRRLGYGRCRLTAAVPRDASPTTVEDLAGLRVATSHPHATRLWFESRSIPVQVIPLSGAVEVAPRLGLAEAIVDLVSTGTTLATNGLRSIGDLLASEAILVGGQAALRERADDVDRLSTMLGAVLEGRRRKYLLMNAPAERLADLEALLPGLAGPSVIPLAHAGMIAIHAVVDADDVWTLLPRLRGAGATGILVLPIEKLIP
jgi:ATP phosphoribosyltransferase